MKKIFIVFISGSIFIFCIILTFPKNANALDILDVRITGKSADESIVEWQTTTAEKSILTWGLRGNCIGLNAQDLFDKVPDAVVKTSHKNGWAMAGRGHTAISFVFM
jgi:hypothetical protein